MKTGILAFILFPLLCSAQYDPAGGELGSISIHKDHPSIYAWADSVIIERSWMDIADTSLGRASAGADSNAIGAANGSVVSLRDGGIATAYFRNGIINGKGYDIAVFENGFKSGDAYFLELAFVEVSKNGIDFFRFPSLSSADTANQLTNADVLEPSWYHNLAGKHQSPYGSLFDLDDVELDTAFFVRVVDVVGAINPPYSRVDSKNRSINDPYPTAFAAGGFDLDAIAALQGQFIHSSQLKAPKHLLYPNLIKAGTITHFTNHISHLEIYNSSGSLIYSGMGESVVLPATGMYVAVLNIDGTIQKQKLCAY